jgi:hypothetical protein
VRQHLTQDASSYYSDIFLSYKHRILSRFTRDSIRDSSNFMRIDLAKILSAYDQDPASSDGRIRQEFWQDNDRVCQNTKLTDPPKLQSGSCSKT